MCGDSVYADVKKKDDFGKLQKCYDKLAAQPGYQKLLETCPVLATWDDHDYGYNDAGGDYVLKKESQQVFLDFFGVAKNSPRRTQEGVFYATTFGPADKCVQVILLDTRYFRSPLKKSGKGGSTYVPDNDPEATFLGEFQWKWLETQLRQPARLRLIVSSIQLVAEDHAYEKWMNFPLERARFFKLLQDTRAQGVVVLSGDRHLAELSSIHNADLGYPLFDLTSSGLTQGYTKGWRNPEVNKHRVATMTHGNNFGMVTVNWSAADPQVALQIRDEVGDVTIQEKLSLSWLQSSKKKKGM